MSYCEERLGNGDHVLGRLAAHSILQEGPGIPCLSPCLYQYIISRNSKRCFPEKSDFPLTLATHEVITLGKGCQSIIMGVYMYFLMNIVGIQKLQLDNATTDDEVDEICDLPASYFIISSSGWSITEPVTHSSRLFSM